MILKFLILSVIFSILHASPTKPSGSGYSSSNKNPQITFDNRDYNSAKQPIDLSLKNRYKDQNAHSTTSWSMKEKFDCSQCDKSYITKSNLNRHVDSIHKGITFDCQFCGKKYAANEKLKDHIYSRHQENREPFHCDKCDFQTYHRGNLYVHKSTNHNK